MYKWLISCGQIFQVFQDTSCQKNPSQIRPWSQCTCDSRPKAWSPVISGCGRFAGWFKGESLETHDFIELKWQFSNFLEGFTSSISGNVASMLSRQGWAMWCFWKNQCWSSPATIKATNGRSSSTASDAWEGRDHFLRRSCGVLLYQKPWGF